MQKVSAFGALALAALAAGFLAVSRHGRVAHGDDWAMSSRDSRLVESVLSAPVGDDFYGLAYATTALQIMRIEPEGELAATAFERAVLTAWIDTSASPAKRPNETVREAIERERPLGTGSLAGMRQEAIAVAKRRRIPEASPSITYNLAIPLAPYRAVLNTDRARIANHPASVAARTRVRESSCSERGSCRNTFMRSEVPGFLLIVFGAGAAIGLGLAVLNAFLRRGARSTAGEPAGVGCTAITLALLSGPLGVIGFFFAALNGPGKEWGWLAVPGVLIVVGIPISIVALLALFLVRRWVV